MSLWLRRLRLLGAVARLGAAPGPPLIHLDLRPTSVQWVLLHEGQDDGNELLRPLHHERMA